MLRFLHIFLMSLCEIKYSKVVAVYNSALQIKGSVAFGQNSLNAKSLFKSKGTEFGMNHIYDRISAANHYNTK